MRYLIFFIASLFLIGVSYAAPLDIREKSTLQKLKEIPVSVSILVRSGEMRRLAEILPGRSTPFYFIDTLLTRIPAKSVLELAKDERVRDIELIDDGLARTILLMLGRLEQLHLYIRTGIHSPASLNISLGPPRPLINGQPSRTGERTIRRAIETFTLGLELPITIPVGNDGPEPGSVNPWALARNVILVTATGEEGGEIWAQASRLATGDNEHFLVSAWGINAITGRDTRFESNAPIEPELVNRFGPDIVSTLRFMTGTSFAAPHVSIALCYLHQAEAFLRNAISRNSQLEFRVPPHIRGILDYAIDRSAPQFQLRQADRRQKYGGLLATISPEHKSRIYRALTTNGIDLDLRLRPEVAKRFLTAIAQPKPQEDSGIGFIDAGAAANFVANMRVTDLIDLYADSNDPRKVDWKSVLKEEANPQLMNSEFSSSLIDYCSNYDLILALPVAERE